MLKRLSAPWACRLGLLGPWLVAQEPQRLCRRLRLEGFERLVDADDGSAPLRLDLDPGGPWPAALWAIAYYRGPLTVTGADARSIAGLDAVGVTLGETGADAGADREVEVGVRGGALKASADFDGGQIVVRFETGRPEASA